MSYFHPSIPNANLLEHGCQNLASDMTSLILLMPNIMHQPVCKKNSKQRDKRPTSTGEFTGFLVAINSSAGSELRPKTCPSPTSYMHPNPMRTMVFASAARRGPLHTTSGFIPSYTHLQPWLNRVCWGYN